MCRLLVGLPHIWKSGGTFFSLAPLANPCFVAHLKIRGALAPPMAGGENFVRTHPRAHPLNAGAPPLLIGWLWPWVEIPPKGSNVCTCFLAGLTLATATFRSHRLPVTNYTAHGIRGTSCVKDLPGFAAPKRESNLQPVDCKSSALTITLHSHTGR